MRSMSNNKGFSLLELLTVIAIIAILAGLIFPVMARVKENARVTQCITNMHDIQVGLKMYKMDNRTYPTTLGPIFQSGIGFQPVIPPADESTLYRDEIKTPKVYRCPSSPKMDYSEMMTVNYPTGNKLDLYAVDSYDAQAGAPDIPTGSTDGYPKARYVLRWANSVTDLTGLQPHPPGTPNTPELQQQDFERQLCFKNPPDDTVVTWCVYHRTGQAQVLFLDGHVDKIPEQEIADSMWRVRPRQN